jgi:hypothetical protein
MINEIWLDIKNFENLYQVSNLGRIKSVYKRTNFNTYKETILSPGRDSRGYLQVILYKNNLPKGRRIHRLVAEAFIHNPENKRTVNHIDENKLNNTVSNLEWSTNQENIDHSQSKKIIQLKDNKIIKIWKSASEAGHNGFHQGHISKCCNNKSKSHKGFIWKFYDNIKYG